MVTTSSKNKPHVGLSLKSLFVIASALICATESKADPFTYTTIEGPDGKYAFLYEVNNVGQIVGVENSSGFIFNLNSQTYVPVSVPGSSYTIANSINDLGDVAGMYQRSDGNYSGFVFDGKKYHKPMYPGSVTTSITGINNEGHFVGTYSIDANHYGGYVYNGSYIDLGKTTFPYGINNRDEIVGTYYPTGQDCTQCGFVLSNGTLNKINPYGGDHIYVTGINDGGQIIGYYEGGVGFMSDGPSSTYLNFPHITDQSAKINNSASFVGEQSQPYLAAPTSLMAQTGVDGKQGLALTGEFFDPLSTSLAVGSIALQPPDQLDKNVGAFIFVSVLAGWLTQDDESFANQIELSAGMVKILKATGDELFKSNPKAFKLQVASFVTLLAGPVIDEARADDPPDPNYTVVEQPQRLRLQTTHNANLDNIIADYLTYASVSAAALHAAERWQGAQLANDQTSANMQASAYPGFVAQVDTAKSVLQADNQEAIDLLPHVNLKNFPGGVKAIAAAFNAQCGLPLDQTYNETLLNLGMSQSAIDYGVCKFVKGITPKSINENYAKLLAQPIP